MYGVMVPRLCHDPDNRKKAQYDIAQQVDAICKEMAQIIT